MNNVTRRLLARWTAVLGLLGLAAMGGRDWPVSARAADKVEEITAQWPALPKRIAEMMIEKHGQPHRRDGNALTWLGLYGGRRTVVHRANPEGGVVEQTVRYKVPEGKVAELEKLDPRLKIDRESSELSAMSDSLRTDFLLLNLAHEVASGFRGVESARSFLDRAQRLAVSGKESQYREGLLFEREIPVTVHPDKTLPESEPTPTPAP